MISNGFLQAGVQVGLNGIDNIIQGGNFFKNWYYSGAMGLFNGIIAGGMIANEQGANYWWGNEVAYNRTQWSFLNIDKPDYYIDFNIPNVGSKAMNDCVPSTFAEIESKKDGIRSYDNFKKGTNYTDGEGVYINKDDYERMIRGAFGSVEKMKTRNLFDPNYMQSIADKNGVVSIHFQGHADNVSKVAIYNRNPSKNKLYFRQGIFNFNTKTIRKHQINNIFRIF